MTTRPSGCPPGLCAMVAIRFSAALVSEPVTFWGLCAGAGYLWEPVKNPGVCVTPPTHLSLNNLVKRQNEREEERRRESLCTHPLKNDRLGLSLVEEFGDDIRIPS